MDERDIELATLRAQVAALTKERDDLAAIVWGKIKGKAPSMNMGGQPAPQTKCAMCGWDCTGHAPNMAYGVRYCDDCVGGYTQDFILSHARNVMAFGGTLVVDKHGAPVNKPVLYPTAPKPVHRDTTAQKIMEAPFKDTTDTQIIDRNEWDAWVASLTSGQKP